MTLKGLLMFIPKFYMIIMLLSVLMKSIKKVKIISNKEVFHKNDAYLVCVCVK